MNMTVQCKLTSLSLVQLKDLSGLDGCGMFFLFRLEDRRPGRGAPKLGMPGGGGGPPGGGGGGGGAPPGGGGGGGMPARPGGGGGALPGPSGTRGGPPGIFVL